MSTERILRVYFVSFSVIMVVGAGRGPLVRASFAASQACDRAIKLYAIEKNPNAIVTYVFLLKQQI